MAPNGGQTTVGLTVAANMDPSGVLSAVKQMQSAFSGLKLPGDIGTDLEKSFGKATDLLKKYQTQLSKGINTKTDAKNITKTGSQINEVLDEIVTHINSINGQQIFLKADVSGLNTLKTNIENARTAWKNAIQEFRKGSDIEKVLNEIAEKTTRSNLTQGSISSAKTLFDKGDLEGYRNALDDIYNRLKNLKDTTIKNVVENLGLQDAGSKAANLDQIKKRLEDISKIDFSGDSNVDTKFKAITTAVTEYETEVKRASQAGQNAFNNINVDKTVKDTRDLVNATDQYKNSVMSAKDQVQQLQQSTQYFFSLRNMINLFKRGIDDAIQSVKELDKAMTETAVVTDYKVSDLWGMLPEYTQIANELGATTQGAYETMTLYFQQGLDQQQAFEIGAETMKMARIAGLDYAEATDMMTAALRGFNMELNETSAQRINDVYSKIAAVTASDTEELGTAMQRTASIAHSAGMSFEGTTAFLAQAIETTREPAENLGTAMKTIIARFQELKKNPLEIGEVDGEEVDYNKIDAALKTIGVDLKDTNGQFRELDKVFLDISQRWDSLSQTQQRYIATTAAGSRQQSRFIAMMSNYDRTMELVNAANNSAGASEEQFGKTMDSLEAKLNKLHNAWQQFTMGIANNSMIKGAVDGITGLLTVTNKLIDTFSLGIGPVKSLLSLLMAFTGLKMTGRFANSLIGGLGGILDPSVGFGKGFLGGAVGVRQQASAAQAQMIYQPIVNELRALPARMKEQKVSTEGTENNSVPFNQQAFKQARNNIAELTKYGQKYSAEAIIKQFKGLNIEQQKVLKNTMIGTSSKVDATLLGRYGAQDKAQSKAIQIAASNYRNQAKVGTIAWSEYYNKVSDPVAMRKALEGNPKVSQATMEWVSGMADKTTDQAKANIAKAMEDKLYNSGAFDAVTNEQEYQKILNEAAEAKWKEMSEAQQAAARRKAWRDINPEEPLQDNTGTKLLNGLGQIGAGISSAGMSLQSFGALLTSSANPALQAFGGALTAIGGVLSSVGMGLSGLVNSFNVLTNSGAMKSLANGLSSALGTTISAGATTGILAGVAALTAIAVSAYKKHIQKLKDAGENVVKEYKEANEKYTSSISDLTTWQQELPRLQEGVDAYGNNVSLDTTDYERYREIINGIAELNPDIVEGYNAQGDAIIRNNNALDQTLAKQKELQKLATEEYLSQQSLATLIRARDTTDAFKKDKVAGGSESVVEAHNLISAMRQAGLGDDFFEALGFDYSKLQASHNNPEIQRFIMENEQIAHEISQFYDQAGIDIDSHISEGLDNLTIAVEAEKEAIQDVYDNLMTYTSTNHLVPTNLTPNLQGSFNKGVELIAKSRLGAVGMQKAVENLAKQYDGLNNENSKYSKIMEKVRAGQEEYARTLDASSYKGKEYQKSLLELAQDEQELADKTDILQEKIAHTNLAEFYTNEAEKAFNFTNKQVTDLTNAFAQFTDEINIAKNAYTDWQKQLESINSPEQGVNSYKQILDSVFKETEDSNGVKHQYNTEAKGRPELWTGAAQILSDDWLRYKDTDAVAKKLKELQPLFEEGQEGAAALGNKIREALNADEEFDGHKFSDLFEITDKGIAVKDGVNINDELTESLAHYWDLQTPALVAALQNASQYGISLMHSTADQRTALSNDVRASAGVKSHVQDELGRDITDLIVPRDVLVEGFHAAGEYNEAVISEGIQALRKEQGVFTTERVLASKDATKLQKEYGITQDNFLKVLGQHLGESEVKETYEGYYGEGSWTQEQQTEYDEIQEGIQSALEETTSEVPDIASSVANIESMLAAKLYESGEATNFDKLNEFHRGIKGDEQLIDTSTDKLVAAGVDKEHQYTKKDFDQYYKDNESVLRTSENIIKQLNTGLENLTPGTEQYEAYSEQLKQAKEDYQYALAAKENADNYAAEQGWDGSSQPPSFDETQIQNKINEVVAAGWGQLLNGIPPTALATPEAQNAMSVLAQNAFSPDMMPTPEIMAALQTLGVDFDQAVQSGLDAWPDSSEVEAEAAEKVTETGDTISEAADASNMHLEALAMNTIPGFEKIVGWVGDEVSNFVQDINNIPTPKVDTPDVSSAITKGGNTVADVATAVLKVDTSDSNQKLDSTQQKTNEVVNTINQGAIFTIDVPGIDKLNQAATAASNLSKQGGNQTVGVKASFDAGSVKSGIDSIKGMNAKIQVGANIKPALDTAESARKTIDNKSATINVSTSVKGQNVDIYVTKHVKEKEAYTGVNNKISYTHAPQVGSLAKGTKKGRVGPRNQGGMTLTGELGYEIAWLPSENRSVILGEKGPQMVNLPRDAIVYNHEQSKDIMKKRQGVSAGSAWDGVLPTSNSGGGTSTGNSNNSKQNSSKTINNTAKQIEKTVKDVGDKVYRVTVWWENIARSTQDTQRKMDKAAKDFEKYTKEMQATLRKTGESVASGGGGGDDYIKNIQAYKQLNEQQKNRAKTELDALESSGVNPKAKKKQLKKEYKKGNVAVEEISYKKGKKSKTAYVDLSKYITNGQVDEAALKTIKNSAKRKAVAEAASKALNDERSKYNSAEDNITKAEEALEKMGEELYNTFFKWENELTKIWNITQKIAETENHINRAKSYTELLDARVGSGIQKAVDISEASIDAFSTQVQAQATNLQNNIEALGEERDELRRTMSLTDEKATLTAIQGYLKSNQNAAGQTLSPTEREGYAEWGENLEKQINAINDAWKYLTVTQREDGTLDTKFETTTFEADKQAGLINDEKAKTIQDYVKSMVEKSEAINNRIDTITSSTTEFYNELKTLKDEWAGYADQLWDISSAEQKKELDNFKKLSDSLNNALKNLLDDIKRKLDERRKQEDNTKTEQDISQKQQRLAMLQADTSGGHQVEIAQLQKEIAEAQQNYQRTLEDQMLDRLQQQADQAAQQRERQIELQSATIDAVNNASLVNQWLADPKNPDNKQAMYDAFMAANEADTKPDAIREQLERQFEELYLGIITNKDKQEELYSNDQTQNQIINQIEDGTIKIANWSGQESGILDAIKTGIDELNTSGNQKSLSEAGKVVEGTSKAISTPPASNPAPAPAPAKPNPLDAYKAKVQAAQSNKKMGANEFKSVVAFAQAAGVSMTQMGKDLAKTEGLTWAQVVKAAKKAGYDKATVTSWWGNVSTRSKNAIKDWSKYTTGGLADYTGPAWLDGTPSKPELVLNAKDTQNFLALRDVLSKAIGSTNSITNSYGGDNIFEININVDKIEKDYDVDRVADRVKKKILESSSYRNVTQVRNFR